MSVKLPVEPGMIHVFAGAVGDTDPVYVRQWSASPGTPLISPPTFSRVAENFDTDHEFRATPDGGSVPLGGTADRLHAEQHFEYLRPIRAGELLTAITTPGRTWTKTGRTGVLHFSEMVTEFIDDSDEVVIRSTKVSVRIEQLEAP